MENKNPSRSILKPGISIRSGLTAGRTMCYQEINDIWYPLVDSSYPILPTVPSPTPSSPDIQWLNCQSCQGSRASDRALQNATCEVCRM